MQYRKEIMNEGFTKHLCEIDGFGFVLHYFDAVDPEGPHNHPFPFNTHILTGGYVEEVYKVENRRLVDVQTIYRAPMTAHRVESAHIHRIIELPNGPCKTIMLPEAWEREWGFYSFEGTNSYFRKWNEEEFKKIHHE